MFQTPGMIEFYLLESKNQLDRSIGLSSFCLSRLALKNNLCFQNIVVDEIIFAESHYSFKQS